MILKKKICQKCSIEHCDICYGNKTESTCTSCGYYTPIYENNEIKFCNYTCETGTEDKCLTCDEKRNECSSCNIGYKLINGKCIINYSFIAKYRTYGINQNIKLIYSDYKDNIIELIIDNEKKEPCVEYTFEQVGEHIVYFLLNITHISSLNELFFYIDTLTSVSFSKSFDTRHIKSINYMFSYCYSLTSIDFNYINTTNIEEMTHIFMYCSSLSYINISSLNTKNVKNMESMFFGCTSLKSLDIQNLNTENTIQINHMLKKSSH